MPARHKRQGKPFTQNRNLSKITLAVAGVTVMVPAAVAAGMATSGGADRHAASQLAMAGSHAGAGQRAVAVSTRIPMTGASRAEVTSRVARLVADRAADRRAAELLADQLAAEQQADQQAAQAAPVQQSSSGSGSAAPSGNPQQIAMSMLGSFGWPSSQFGCLQSLWNAESGWNVYASNPSTGAYGIPQALPGSKMASAGPNWQSDAATQIRWGLGYIKGLYSSPCGAWAHEQATGWY